MNYFLARKFIEYHKDFKSFTVTKGNSIVTNNKSLSDDTSTNHCCAEEADKKLVRHMIQCVRTGLNNVVIRTVDTDVLLLLISYRYDIGNFNSKVYIYFGTGKNKCFYDINDITLKHGRQVC